MFDLVRNILLAGLGAQEKIKESIDELVKKGELSESQGAKIIKEWTEKANKSSSELRENMSEIISRTLEKMNLPSRDDIENLEKKIENLASRISAIEKGEKKES